MIIERDKDNAYSHFNRAFDRMGDVGLSCADYRNDGFKHEEIGLCIQHYMLRYEKHLTRQEKEIFRDSAKQLIPDHPGCRLMLKYRNRSLQTIEVMQQGRKNYTQ